MIQQLLAVSFPEITSPMNSVCRTQPLAGF